MPRLIGHARTAGELSEGDIADLLGRAVSEVRAASSVLLEASSRIHEGCRMVEELYAAAAKLGLMCLEIAPGYLAAAEAFVALEKYAEEIGMDLDDVLAHRRFAITNDRRCLRDVL